MLIPPAMRAFVQGPVLMTLATRDSANRPMIARGVGLRPVGPATLRLAFCLRLWPETLANLLDNGWLALTVVQPGDYRAFQFKGRARIAAAGPEDEADAALYRERTRQMLCGHGVAEEQLASWLEAREIAMADLEVERIFEQTPGPRAGMVIL